MTVRARGMNQPQFKNALEYEYGLYLDALKSRGEVSWWAYEVITLKLADGATYTPDFAVVMADGELQFHETKGHWREAAKVRIKVAAGQTPFRFIAIKKDKRLGWKREEF